MTEAWITLSVDEALKLRETLDARIRGDDLDPKWHAHVEGDGGIGELTIARFPVG